MSYLFPFHADSIRQGVSAAQLQQADREAWRELYRRAPDDDIWHPLPFLGEVIARMRLMQELPLVDLACGDGGQICGVPPGIEVLGVDQSPEALSRAERRSLRTGRCRAGYANGYVEAVPLAAQRAGGAILIDVLSCFLDPMPVLREAHRILAPGAALAVTSFTLADPLSRATGAVPGKPVWIEGFINVFYEPSDIAELCRDAGFTVESVSSRSDGEAGHPGYREQTHEHHRAVIIGRKRSP